MTYLLYSVPILGDQRAGERQQRTQWMRTKIPGTCLSGGRTTPGTHPGSFPPSHVPVPTRCFRPECRSPRVLSRPRKGGKVPAIVQDRSGPVVAELRIEEMP